MIADFLATPAGQFVFIVAAILAIMIPVLIGVAYLTYAERKVLAAMQLRKGPNVVGPFGLFQPFADAIKLMMKETVIPSGSNRLLFLMAPMLTFGLALIAWAVIPFGPGLVLADINVGVLYLFAISSLGVYGIIIAGWASNSKYAFLGALRSAAQMVSYEVSIGFVIITVLLCVGSLNLSRVVEAQQGLWFFGEYANMILMSAMTTILFLGGWLPPFDVAPLNWVPGPIWFALKIALCLFVFLWVRATFPRYRYDQLMRLGWKVFLPLSLLWVALTSGALMLFGWLPSPA